MNSTWYAKRRRNRSAERFFLITDLFHLSAKEWAELMNDLDSMTLEQRYELLNGRDDEYGRYE